MERIGAGKCGMHRRSNEVVYICKIERHAIHLCSFLTNAVKEWLLLGQGQDPPTHTDSAGGGGGFWRADFGVCIHFRAPPGFSTLGTQPPPIPRGGGRGATHPTGNLKKNSHGTPLCTGYARGCPSSAQSGGRGRSPKRRRESTHPFLSVPQTLTRDWTLIHIWEVCPPFPSPTPLTDQLKNDDQTNPENYTAGLGWKATAPWAGRCKHKKRSSNTHQIKHQQASNTTPPLSFEQISGWHPQAQNRLSD